MAADTVGPDRPKQVRELVSRGDYLAAYDLAISDPATAVPAAHLGSLELPYLAVLALARSGATDRAEEEFRRLGLADAVERGVAGSQAEDIAALEARIAKDRALTSTDDRRRLSAAAAELYQRVYDRTHGSYPCIDAATMWLLAGERRRSAELARQAMRLCALESPGEPDYWTAATLAEAALLLRDPQAAAVALAKADRTSIGSFAARATTRGQLELICAENELDAGLLEVLANPRVIHYAGHRMAPPGAPGRFTADEERRVGDEIRSCLDTLGVGFGYGSAASGADLLFAEALLDRDAELHVLLPFERDQFIETSVADSGPAWVERFGPRPGGGDVGSLRVRRAVPRRPGDVRLLLTGGDGRGDPAGRGPAQPGRPGRGVGRARGRPDDVTGTAVDLARWRDLGRASHVIATSGPRSGELGGTGALSADADARPPPDSPPHPAGRMIRAMLFADIAGFSTLDDNQLPVFMSVVMGALADVIVQFDRALISRNTWGDGIYLVFRDVASAASCALAMQQAVRDLDFASLGLGGLHGLRIGAHVGPVFEDDDPIRGEPVVYGANVTRAARIEPRTPEGEVYVTHPFAALAALGSKRALVLPVRRPCPDGQELRRAADVRAQADDEPGRGTNGPTALNLPHIRSHGWGRNRRLTDPSDAPIWSLRRAWIPPPTRRSPLAGNGAIGHRHPGKRPVRRPWRPARPAPAAMIWLDERQEGPVLGNRTHMMIDAGQVLDPSACRARLVSSAMSVGVRRS